MTGALKQLRVSLSLLPVGGDQQTGSASLRSADGENIPNLTRVDKQRRYLYSTAKPKKKAAEPMAVEESDLILENLTNVHYRPCCVKYVRMYKYMSIRVTAQNLREGGGRFGGLAGPSGEGSLCAIFS